MAMSVNLQKSYDKMIQYDKGLTAYDFHNGVSYVVDQEGSLFYIQSSFMKKDGDYLWVLAEHHNPMIFAIDELEFFEYLVPQEIENDS